MHQLEGIVLSLALVIAGAINLRFAFRFRRDDAFALHYTMTSPKAALWRARYGVDRTMAMTRRYFVPLGVVLATTMVIGGLVLLGIFSVAASR